MKSNLSIGAIAWILLTAACLIVLLIGLKTVLKRSNWKKEHQQKVFLTTTVVIILWAALLLVLSYNDFFSNFSKLPPRPALAIIIPLLFVLTIAFSKKGQELLKCVPPHWLVYMQSFRIIVELFLLSAFQAGELPIQMTFEGRNFDVFTGLLAIPVGYMLAKRKTHANKVAIGYNIVGILLLINILVIAVLSMPTSMRYFMNEPANALVAQFPFILLPGILVPLAYTLHIFSLRQLISKQGATRPSTSRLKIAKSDDKNQLAASKK